MGTMAAMAWAGAVIGTAVVAFFVVSHVRYALYLWRWMKWHDADARYRDGLCLHCGYDLAGNVSGVCPECGKEAVPR